MKWKTIRQVLLIIIIIVVGVVGIKHFVIFRLVDAPRMLHSIWIEREGVRYTIMYDEPLWTKAYRVKRRHYVTPEGVVPKKGDKYVKKN